MAIEIRCDCKDDGCVVVGEQHCPELVGFYVRDNRSARLEAERGGWSTESTGRTGQTVRDYCPACVAHRAAEGVSG